jgi:hypothetical protein
MNPGIALTLAWRHVVDNLIEYFQYSESMQASQSKEFTKLSKTLEVPFKGPDFAPDGIAVIWQGLRDKSNQMSSFYGEQASSMKNGVLRDLHRLRDDIKEHLKELKEGQHGSKKVGKDIDKFVLSSVTIVNDRVTLRRILESGFPSLRRIQLHLRQPMIHMCCLDRSVIACTMSSMNRIVLMRNFSPFNSVVNYLNNLSSKEYKKPLKVLLT